MTSVYVLGLDPGFASIGYTVYKLGTPDEVVRMGLIRTEKSSAKRNVRASEDNLERARTIAEELQALLKEFDIRLICAETMSFPRNSSAAAKMAMCWGVMAALSLQHSIPVAQATPQEVKKAVTGQKDASKEDVQAALKKRWALEALVEEIPPSKQEHPFDALAVVIACSGSEVFRFARKMVVASCEASTA